MVGLFLFHVSDFVGKGRTDDVYPLGVGTVLRFSSPQKFQFDPLFLRRIVPDRLFK